MRIVAAIAALVAAVAVPAGADDPCARTAMPYAGIPGASLVAEDHVTLDEPAVRYTRWRGFVPSFDGMPMSVDVTVPCGASAPLPTVVMLHGFTDDKTVWQETGKGDRSVSRDRPEQNSYWNNVSFVSRGYAVLNYTARGWNDSCGPDLAGATPVTPAPHCLAYEYWIHLDDKRWEVRDAQWLTGALVQSGLADRSRLVITGGSYGGAPTASAALLADNVMCGGAPQPAELGPDPCTGKASGDLAAWTTPDGTTPLNWAAAVPMYTFADIIQVLAPNGRGSDGWVHAPPDGDHTSPFGVPIQSTLAGLLAAGMSAGYFAPPGVDPDSDIVVDATRVLAGNPFPASDPLVARGVRVYRDFKSPITTPPHGRVPIFWVHGFTDPLFPGTEALQIYNLLRRADPSYPVKLFFGDFGHDYTGQRQDEWDRAHAEMNTFVDHFLRPDRPPAPLTYDVQATVTRCLDHDAPMRVERAPTWDALHPRHVSFVGTDPGTTVSAIVSRAGLATDPISTATLPLPGAYRGCRIMRPAAPDNNSATYEFATADELVLMGGPVVDVTYDTTGPDTELNVRVWDVTADGSAQGLVTRGTYRSLEPPGTGHRARFQIAPQGYRFAPGHRVKVEVAANDAPYYQQSNVPALVRVSRLELTLPLLGTSVGTEPTDADRGADPLPATGGVGAGGAGLVALLLGVACRAWSTTRAGRASTTSRS
jgi:predicted acyl esterase